MTPGVAVVLIEDAQILLARRAAPSFHGMWCVPCGHVQRGESLEEAAQREFKEETGLDVEIGDVCFAHLSLQRPDRPVVGVWFNAKRLGGELRAADDVSEVQFFAFEELPEEMAFDGDKLLIEKLRTERRL